MMRTLAITVAAVAISVGSTLVGSTLSASAMHGGHASGHFGHHAFFGHPFHHHFGRGFFFAEVPSAYDDACYMRVWTRSGWRWRSICF
jgi:hypothetical protein